jgi:hypothetical protein
VADRIKETKYQKVDCVKNGFFRLTKKTKIAKPFGSLKKTSGSLIRDSEFTALEQLFLGHAGPLAHKHYTVSPGKMLDKALTWLGQQFGLVEAPPVAGAEQSAAAPAAASPSPGAVADEGKSKGRKRSRSRRGDYGSKKSP